MGKAKIEIQANNNFRRQECIICGRDERPDGIEMRIRPYDIREDETPYYVCPLCQGMLKGCSYKKDVPKAALLWPEKLREKASRLKIWAEYLEEIADMEFILPTNEEWDKEIKQRAEWDKEMKEDQEDLVTA